MAHREKGQIAQTGWCSLATQKATKRETPAATSICWPFLPNPRTSPSPSPIPNPHPPPLSMAFCCDSRPFLSVFTSKTCLKCSCHCTNWTFICCPSHHFSAHLPLFLCTISFLFDRNTLGQNVLRISFRCDSIRFCWQLQKNKYSQQWDSGFWSYFFVAPHHPCRLHFGGVATIRFS